MNLTLFRAGLAFGLLFCTSLPLLAQKTRTVTAPTSDLLNNGRLPYAIGDSQIQDSPISRIDDNGASVTNYLVSAALTRGTVSLSGRPTTNDWSVAQSWSWSLTNDSTNFNINVPTTVGQADAAYLKVSSVGSVSLFFSFPGGITTNWPNNYLVTPRAGETVYEFIRDGASVTIKAFPDAFPTAGSQLFGSGTTAATTLFSTNFDSTMQFAGVQVNDDPYGAGWNGSTNVPTKNALYDKIETLTGGSADVQIFTTTGSNTWTKPSGKTITTIVLIGGGGGGGSGRRGAAASVRCGGGGGASGAFSTIRISTALLGATETVIVGGGGPGGAAVSADEQNGNAGTAGTNSSFGIWLKAVGGAAGAGGTAAAGAGGVASATGGYTLINFGGGSASGTGGGGAVGTSSLTVPGGGGASGAGITSGDVASAGANGGAGSSARATVPTAGTAGAIATNGGDGTSVTANEAIGGAGGGSGGSRITAGAAGNGGNGGLYGGGGGGGGAALNATSTSGTGGTGAQGIAIIISE